MSIVALKRKSQTLYKNLSANSNTGFSINGTHRSQGYIGQDSRGRSLQRALSKNGALKGYGGCCGNYLIKELQQNTICTTEDPTVVKSSSLNNLGLISTKYRWVRRPQPYSSTKPDYNNNINSQQQYIELKRRYIEQQTINCNINTTVGFTTTTGCANLLGLKKPRLCNLVVDPNKNEYKSQSTYISQLSKSCTGDDVNKAYTQKSTQQTPFACRSVATI